VTSESWLWSCRCGQGDAGRGAGDTFAGGNRAPARSLCVRFATHPLALRGISPTSCLPRATIDQERVVGVPSSRPGRRRAGQGVQAGRAGVRRGAAAVYLGRKTLRVGPCPLGARPRTGEGSWLKGWIFSGPCSKWFETVPEVSSDWKAFRM